ncbi:UDP-glucose/GDP-mannose dehydrogenase family protein [Paenibacillus sp. GYB004]|uniref:UDP-glucose/GDP-mannose dehydrogenase family protein n=1 Tax=Paenibacillus sp. GYB004 TaxID=2994393 RepID=UPI002F961C12
MNTQQRPYAVSVFGLGYVGCVSAACLAQMGHKVVGVDINPDKIEMINQGKPTIVEKGIAELVMEQHLAGRLTATLDIQAAVNESDLSLICVGTPADKNGHTDLTFIWHVVEQIAEALKEKDRFHTIVIRSTVPPGTCSRIEELLVRSGKSAETDFAVVSNPEFLREGSSVDDYFHPPYTLLGTANPVALGMLRQLYGPVDAAIVETNREVAEMIKYVNNSFHALKIVFANEIGAICHSLGIDPHHVMDLFCKDHHLNLSSAYLKPGFAYGGSCLPKDLKAINALARSRHVETSVLSVIERSNSLQIDRALEAVLAAGKVKVGVLGLAFKQGTDDLRESPVVKLLEGLIGKGYEVKIYDQEVLTSKLMGANKHYIETAVPHIARLLAPNLDEIRQFADVVVVAQKNRQYAPFVEEMLFEKPVIDLVRLFDEIPASSNYKGLLW